MSGVRRHYTLSERFQLYENVRTVRIIQRIGIIVAICAIGTLSVMGYGATFMEQDGIQVSISLFIVINIANIRYSS